MAKSTPKPSEIVKAESVILPTDPGKDASLQDRLAFVHQYGQRSGVRLSIEVGGMYREIRRSVPHGDFDKTVKAMGEADGPSLRSVQILMNISRKLGPFVAEKPARADSLPNDRSSLDALASKKDASTLAVLVADGTVNSQMKRSEVRNLTRDPDADVPVVLSDVAKIGVKYMALSSNHERSQVRKSLDKWDKEVVKAEAEKAKATAAKKKAS